MKLKAKKHYPVKIISYIFLIIITFFSLFPFYLMFVSGTNSTSDILGIPPALWFGENLIDNFNNLNERMLILRVIFNSLFITITYTVLTLLLASLSGYALAKFEFKGKKLFFTIIIVTLMIPFQVLLVPLYNLMNAIGWQNSYQAVIVPLLANAFGVFLMRQNMLSFPDSLIEAARIDGCNEFSIFMKIVIPTMKPALGALAIYTFMSMWGNFMWPLIILNTKEMYTLPVALASLKGLMRIDYGMIMLAATIATIPIMIVFLIFQKQFISGIMGGAVKE
ncbi:sugar ABC transporter ATP-binding protein [Vallitalea longa]|uniref:Sugar ABC transporter ATP-binding protein n=1 Tax=Vallitalea longa TaxID=2936439 RepID=A0A9W5YDV0_9FIRM|nr:carbohydrate ABC transporter permease [Vallitalea longa]GKX30114.1 sugar ABC transporter ATP-binding protein [Vallitalea longa]